MDRLAPIALALALAAAALAGCGDDDGSESAPPQPSTAFIEPEPGERERGSLTAVVQLDDFIIHAAGIGQANRPGRGHLRFIMDGGRFDKRRYAGPNGELARQLGTEGRYSPSVEASITYRCLPVGPHSLVVELLNNDGTPVGARDEVGFEIIWQRPSCEPRGLGRAGG